MKNRIISLLLVFIFMFSIVPSFGIAASATSDVTSIESEAVIKVEETWSNPGKTVDINLTLTENPGILGATITISWDEGLTLIADASEEAFNNLTYMAPSRYISSGTNFVWYGNEVGEAVDGTILKLTFQVSETAQNNDILPIRVSYTAGDVVDENDNDVILDITDGYIRVITYQPGDVNGDGYVNVRDLVRLSQYISDGCKTDPEGYNAEVEEYACDVNEDDRANVRDLIKISQYISDGGQTNPDGYNAVLKPAKMPESEDSDTQGTPAKLTRYNTVGSLKYKDEYDANGKLIKATYYNADGSINGWSEVAYDANGRLIKETFCNADGSINGWSEYAYDANGRWIESTIYNADGEINGRSEAQYDENEKCVKSAIYNTDGSLYYIDEYDVNGKWIKRSCYNSDASLEYIDEYDEDGKRIKRTYYNADGCIDYWYEYEYDGSGNLIKSTRYNADGTIPFVENVTFGLNEEEKDGKTVYVPVDFDKFSEGFEYVELTPGKGSAGADVAADAKYNQVKATTHYAWDGEYVYGYVVIEDPTLLSRGSVYIEKWSDPWENDALEYWFTFGVAPSATFHQRFTNDFYGIRPTAYDGTGDSGTFNSMSKYFHQMEFDVKVVEETKTSYIFFKLVARDEAGNALQAGDVHYVALQINDIREIKDISNVGQKVITNRYSSSSNHSDYENGWERYILGAKE